MSKSHIIDVSESDNSIRLNEKTLQGNGCSFVFTILDDTNTTNAIFISVEKAEELAGLLLQAVFDLTEKKVVKNKNEITQEEWRVIDEQRWTEIRTKILDFSDYIHLHSFIKTLSVIEILDGSSLFLVSNAFGIVDKNILIASCMAIMYADSIDFDDDGNIVEIGERLWSIHINFKNTKQKEFEYMQ